MKFSLKWKEIPNHPGHFKSNKGICYNSESGRYIYPSYYNTKNYRLTTFYWWPKFLF